jgi:hypothetical protein|tara:strand:- start:322 stop:522 length:201 start_codon:yes stop_codon:yes gene_type:complete
MKQNIHIDFKVTPTPGPNWGSLDEVNISIPKRKFKGLKYVYDRWFKKTGNVAKNIIMGKERDLNAN